MNTYKYKNTTVRNKQTGEFGIATTIDDDKIKVYWGSDDGGDDAVYTLSQFSEIWERTFTGKVKTETEFILFYNSLIDFFKLAPDTPGSWGTENHLWYYLERVKENMEWFYQEVTGEEIKNNYLLSVLREGKD